MRSAIHRKPNSLITTLCAILLAVSAVSQNVIEDRPYLNPYPPPLNYLERERKPEEDWRLGKSVHKYWVNSWKAYVKRDYEGAIEELKPLLKEKLPLGQLDEVHYAMAFNYRTLASKAHQNADPKGKIRYLKAAASLERYPPMVTRDNFQIAQTYRRLEDWAGCAEYGELSFTVNLKWVEYPGIKSLILAECHLKNNNIERAKYWVDVAFKLRDEAETPILVEQQWIIDAVQNSSNGAEGNTQ